ncbi:MAG: ATP-binding cassette domain-containing protein [Candidatus Dadabacteria bacterium]|nr:MAG: ATP-binding cassette domain-containing protein [Candidatus Dadabacteria bacterium]
MSVIKVNNLTKTFYTFSRREGITGAIKDLFRRDYRELVAVDHISFEVQEGELLGYIGPNGAGKSTSIKMLTGILKPTSGEMEVLGYHPFNQRQNYTRHIGVVFGQRTQLWWDIAVVESFKLLAKIYDVPEKEYKLKIKELSEILDLAPLLNTPVRKLSLGQRIRCDLAASLLHSPSILFLDEPTIGLDAVGKDSIRTFLREINANTGTTIILTTHDLKEIEELCKRIIIIDHGKLIYDGGLDRVKNLPGLKREISIDFSGDISAKELNNLFGGRIEFKQESERHLYASFSPAEITAVEILTSIVGKYPVADVSIAEPDIEEVVMKIYREGITGHAA